jgi:hypothetical protein
LETCQWSSESSAGIIRYSCSYTLGVLIAQRAISQNRSANLKSCILWILCNPLLSGWRYWLYSELYIVETEDQYQSRMVGRCGTSSNSPYIPAGFVHWNW